MVTVHSVTSNSSVFNDECTHFAKIMQNGAVKLGFLTKNLSKVLDFGVGVKMRSWKNKTPECLVKKCQRGYNVKKKYPGQQVPAGRWNYYAESDNNWAAIWQWRT